MRDDVVNGVGWLNQPLTLTTDTQRMLAQESLAGLLPAVAIQIGAAGGHCSDSLLHAALSETPNRFAAQRS